MKKAVFFGNADVIQNVYPQDRLDWLKQRLDVLEPSITLENFEEHRAMLAKVEVIFSTWSMPELTQAHLDAMPALRAVFYAAGSVRYFAKPLIERGIVVVSGWVANAVPVAEFTVAQILLSMKGYFENARSLRGPDDFEPAYRGPGNYGECVTLLGAGAIGSKVVELLSPFRLQVLVFDPFLSEARAEHLKVERVSLEEGFERGFVISNHLANIPETELMLNKALFERMRPHSTFVNTGRGQTVEETGLLEVLQVRPDITALLDVTFPEPPDEGSPFYSLPNVVLSSHIAGSMNNEVVRMADYCLREFEAWEAGRPLRYAVNLEMLATMA